MNSYLTLGSSATALAGVSPSGPAAKQAVLKPLKVVTEECNHLYELFFTRPLHEDLNYFVTRFEKERGDTSQQQLVAMTQMLKEVDTKLNDCTSLLSAHPQRFTSLVEGVKAKAEESVAKAPSFEEKRAKIREVTQSLEHEEMKQHAQSQEEERLDIDLRVKHTLLELEQKYKVPLPADYPRE
ncbi:hypothetical protein QOT17_003035 [Balamuthia mandrillaris]